MHASRLVTRPAAGHWLVCLPTTSDMVELGARDALPLAEALLLVRRTLWPAVPFRPRDQTAAALELHIRAMQAALRGPRAVETLVPETCASDVGRVW